MAVGGVASCGEENAVADRRDRQAVGEKLRHQLLQNLALQIFAHAACAMPAGQEQAIKISAPDLSPRERVFEGRILLHRRVGVSGSGIGAHQPADGDEALQSRQEAPDVQALAGEHHVVGAAGLPARRGKGHAVAETRQHAPADRDFARIEVPVRERNEDFRHVSSRAGWLDEQSVPAV